MDSDARADLVESLGFAVVFDQPDNPQIRYMNQDGELSGMLRPALAPEIRMWCMLTGDFGRADWPVPADIVRSAALRMARARHPSNVMPKDVEAAHFHGMKVVSGGYAIMGEAHEADG